MKEGQEKESSFQLDVVVAASGFGRKEQSTLEQVGVCADCGHLCSLPF